MSDWCNMLDEDCISAFTMCLFIKLRNSSLLVSHTCHATAGRWIFTCGPGKPKSPISPLWPRGPIGPGCPASPDPPGGPGMDCMVHSITSK